MAAFASDRRCGWVRVLVLILCALFIFATIATPPAYAVGETVALFGLAAVLSAATAALGFKLANNAEGQATLQKMVQDFAGASIAAGLVLTGSKVNGLINGMQYIKMAVHNGKTYLDERIFAWCQQWLAVNGVYNSGGYNVPVANQVPDLQTADYVLSAASGLSFYSYVSSSFNDLVSHFNLDLSNKLWQFSFFASDDPSNYRCFISVSRSVPSSLNFNQYSYLDASSYRSRSSLPYDYYYYTKSSYSSGYDNRIFARFSTNENLDGVFATPYLLDGYTYWGTLYYNFIFSNYFPALSSSNNTGLSGTDTLGKDVIDLTLDQILERLKEWAQDWYDAGADSVTNVATGAKDLPLSVTTGAATLNPDVADDGPLVWFPAFGWSLPKLRSGETDTKTVDQGKENASAAEISTVDVAENQTVINSLVSWALNYIDPDTGLFSKFPLCVPYDAYLLVTSSLGVDAVGSDSIFGASPGDLDGVVTENIDTYSDFQPIININNDFELDGKTYPISISIDLTPWQPLVTFFREGMALLLVAELIGSEYKRIRGH